MLSRLGDWLKENGLAVLGAAVKTGIGFAAGGPAGAVAAAADALGLPAGSDEQAVLEAAKQDPQALVKLREIESRIPLAQIKADLQLREAELHTVRELAGIDATDRLDARAMHRANIGRDPIPAWLIVANYILIFVCIIGLGFIISIEGLSDIDKTLLSSTVSMILGAALKQSSSHSDFYFGSSTGSKAKESALIDEVKKNE